MRVITAVVRTRDDCWYIQTKNNPDEINTSEILFAISKYEANELIKKDLSEPHPSYVSPQGNIYYYLPVH